MISLNLDADPDPQPLYAIREAERPGPHGLPGDVLIGALSLTLSLSEDGDIEILEVWENDRRGLHSAAVADRVIVASGPDDRSVLISTGRALRQFGPCPDRPQ